MDIIINEKEFDRIVKINNIGIDFINNFLDENRTNKDILIMIKTLESFIIKLNKDIGRTEEEENYIILVDKVFKLQEIATNIKE